MDFNFVTNLEICKEFISQNYFLNFVYYSHSLGVITSLLLSIFVFIKNRKDVVSKLFLAISLLFIAWSFSDFILWTSTDSRKTMFFWSFINVVENFISVSTLYFAYVFLEKKDAPFKYKVFVLGLMVPPILLIPTSYNLPFFDGISCEAAQGPAIYYFYFVEIVFFLWLVIYALRKTIKTPRSDRRPVLIFSAGAIFFLLLFSGTNVVASITGYWQILQYGLFGMPVFIALLAYLIVRYRAFNVRIIATQAIVIILSILIGSQLFFVTTRINFVLTSFTFLLSILFGILLIRSVKNEIRRKEELQIVTDKLAAANVELKRLDQSKTEFISIASHQLRTPLTAIKGFVSLLLEGSYGTVPAPIADVLDKIYTANDRIVHLVEDLLNISRMESGRLKYEYAEVNIPEFLNELRDTFALVAKKKGLDLTFEVPAGALAPAWIDRQKAFEVVSNLIDNAIKYTSAGSVRVRAEGVLGFVRISVADTGVGIDPDMMPVLFQKFSRGKESGKMHVSGTGLGLYVGKSMIEAQNGHIGVTSEGAGKGSTFFVELPVKQG